MIHLYYWPTPNGWKISVALEEMELDYEVVPVNIGRGEQFAASFLDPSIDEWLVGDVDVSADRAIQNTLWCPRSRALQKQAPQHPAQQKHSSAPAATAAPSRQAGCT